MVTAVLAVCTVLAALAITAAPYPERGRRLLVGLAACGVIVLLRRWPSPVLAVAAACLVMAAGNASLPFGLMLGLAVYLIASNRPRRTSIRAALTAAAVLGGAMLYSALALRNPPLALEAVAGYSLLVAGWFVGDSVAARRRYVAGLIEQAERERAAEAERARRARAVPLPGRPGGADQRGEARARRPPVT